MHTNLELGHRRLRAINWTQVGQFQKTSNGYLMAEYLRRLALLDRELDGRIDHIFFDPGTVFKTDFKDRGEEFFNLSFKPQNAYVAHICKTYLMWCSLLDEENRIVSKFADLFEPLIVIVERGGDFGFHHGELIAGNSAFSVKNWRARWAMSPIDISEKFLNQYDAIA